MSDLPIISVTGTKGKTTTVAIISDVLAQLGKNVLKVDTTGHFVNGVRKSSLDDSKAVWNLVPSVCPGRFLYEFFLDPSLQDNGVAVLECALGSSSTSGLGYRYHDIGIFLNVFEDHIGSSDRISSKEDIVKAKQFIFQRLRNQDSCAIFNADDSYVISAIDKIPRGSTLLPIGITFECYDAKKHLENGGKLITIDDEKRIILRDKDGDTIIADLKLIPWTFNGNFGPSVWNMMAAVAALYAFFDGQMPDGLRKAVEAVRLDKYGGRLTVLENQNGVRIIADYAHEKVSLCSVAELGRGMVKKGGKLIGVVRLAHDRTDELMIDTGKTIAPMYDELVVYDKIDGYFRKSKIASQRFPQIEGRTSTIFSDAIKSVNPNVTRIVREDEALMQVAEIAKPGDVVVFIVNDDIVRSIEFVRDIFKADFI